VLNKWKEKWVHLIERREVMELRSLYIQNYGINDALKCLTRFGPAHGETIERSLLLCGKHVVLTNRSAYWRVAQMMRGLAFKCLVPCRLDLYKARVNWKSRSASAVRKMQHGPE
jgi:hypothetical protein